MKIKLGNDEYIIICFKDINKLPKIVTPENVKSIELYKRGMNNFKL